MTGRITHTLRTWKPAVVVGAFQRYSHPEFGRCWVIYALHRVSQSVLVVMNTPSSIVGLHSPPPSCSQPPFRAHRSKVGGAVDISSSLEAALPVRAGAGREHTTHIVADAQNASALTPPVRPRSSEKGTGRPACRFRSGEQTADAERDLSQVLLKNRTQRKPGFRPTQPREPFTLRHTLCCITAT